MWSPIGRTSGRTCNRPKIHKLLKIHQLLRIHQLLKIHEIRSIDALAAPI